MDDMNSKMAQERNAAVLGSKRAIREATQGQAAQDLRAALAALKARA